MGLRSLVPQNVQPKDIGNPIPSQGDTLASVLGGYQPQQMMTPMQPPQQAPNMSVPQQAPQREPAQEVNPNIQRNLANQAMKNEEAKDILAIDAQSNFKDDVRKKDDDDEFDELLQGMTEDDIFSSDALKQIGVSEEKDLSKFKRPKQDSFASFWDRFKVSVGRDKVEQKKMLDKIYGDGNVTLDNKGEFVVYDPIKKQSHQFDPEGLDIGDIADAGAGTLEFVANVAATVGAAKFSQKIGQAFGWRPGFKTSMTEFLNTSIAGPTVGVAGRSAAVSALGIKDPRYDAASQAMLEVGANMALGAAFNLTSNIPKIMDAAAFGTDVNRMKQYSLFRNAIVDVAGEFGLPNPTPFATQKGADIALDVERNLIPTGATKGKDLAIRTGVSLNKRAGLQFKGVVQKNIEDFQAGMGELNEKAIKYAGERRFSANNVLNTMDEFLSKILFRDENGIYHYPATGKEVQDISTKITKLRTLYSKNGNEELLDTIAHLEGELVQKGSMVAESKAVFGTHEGDKLLKLITDNYNSLRLAHNNGGVSMDALIKHTRAFERGASYDPMIFGDIKPTPEMNNMMKKLAHSTIGDRAEAFDKVFLGRAEEGVWKMRHEKLQEKISKWGEFASYTNPNVMGEEVVEKLFKSQDSEAVLKLRQILGDDSTQWKDLKDAWLFKQFNEGFDESLLVPDPKKYAKTFSSYSPDFLQAMGEVGESGALWRLKRIYQKGANLTTEGLTARSQKNIRDLLTDVSFAFRNSIMGTRAMFKLLGWNKHLIEYMNNEAFQEAIKNAHTNAENTFLTEMEMFAHQATKDSKVVFVKGQAKIIPNTAKGIGSMIVDEGKRGLPGAVVGAGMEDITKYRNYVELQPE